MIKLTKAGEPKALKVAKEKFLDEYLSYFQYENGGYVKTNKIPKNLSDKYNIGTVKNVLNLETNGKCAYCESKLKHISFGDIEHISPKIYRPDLVFEWSNITLACEECNRTRKKDYYSTSEPLVNPYTEDPHEFLFAVGPMIMHNLGNSKGMITKEVLELNREELFERRKEKIEDLQPLLDCWVKAEGQEKKVLERNLLKYIDPSREYSFIIMGYYKFLNVLC